MMISKKRDWLIQAGLAVLLACCAVSCERSGTESVPASLSSDERKTAEAGLTGGTRSRLASVQGRSTGETAELRPGETGASRNLAVILNLANRLERRQALDELAEILIQQDPKQAEHILRQILREKGESSGDAYDFVTAFTTRYAALDAAAAAAWVEFLPLSLKFGACTPVAQHWASTDWQAATHWAQEIEDTGLRSFVLRRISEQFEKNGHTAAAADWAQALSKTLDAVHHTEVISRLWTSADVGGAYQWAAQLPAGEARTTALVAMAGVLAEKDPVSASQWVEKFPDAPSRRQAAGAMITKWAETDPASAARWLAGLGDPSLIENGIRSVGGQWLQKDRPTAEQWIKSAPLSQETKEYLLGRQDRP